MENASKSLPQLERLLTNSTTTKRELDDLIWFLEHPEYEHRVVGIREFIDSPEYLNAGKECWDSIKDDLEELFNGNYTEAVLCQGIGSGKTFASSIIIAYLVYKALCLKDPQEFFNLAKGSQICFINLSIRAEQSKKVVFGEIKARIDNSPWFSNYCPPDPDIRSELRFPKGVIIFPGNSQETFPLGYNILGGVMDEVAWYTDIPTHDVAEEMFNALHSRIKSRFGDKGLLVMISSPRYVDDFIERKMQEAHTNKKIFTRRKKLWESKPPSCFSGKWIDFEGYKIPAEFETESKRNPEAFKRDYMAIPSLALEPYFKCWNLVEQTIDPNLEHPVDEQGRFKEWLKGKGKHYHIHVDLSVKRDATGFCLGHNEGDTVVIDLMLRIKAPVGGEINFAEIRGMIFELRARGFEIVGVTYDGWNSIDSLQILQQHGFQCSVLSVDKDTCAYDTLKEKIYEGKFKCYRYEPFLEEMKRLELVEGKKVNHPPINGSKDVTDAVASVVYNCVANPNNFQFWFGNDTLKRKTQEEIKKESEVLSIDSLVTYGYWQNRRPY